jgi:hypothetical protein
MTAAQAWSAASLASASFEVDQPLATLEKQALLTFPWVG